LSVRDEELRDRYSKAQDDELLALVGQGSAAYTEAAWRLLTEEMARRKLSVCSATDEGERPATGSRGARWIVAALLTLLAPGGGHFLVGRFRRGVLWVAIGAAFTLSIPLTMIIGVAGSFLTRFAAAADVLRVEDRRPAWKPVVAGWVGLIVFAVVWSPVVRTYYTRAYTIPSGAMEPTLLVGDYVMTNNIGYRLIDPQRGDIIVFKYPQDERRDFIKRIIAMPGETVQVRGSQVFVNGQALHEPYIKRTDSPLPGSALTCSGYAYGCEPTVVPVNSYFVMGDNRDNSQDSRYWGFVMREKITGRALLIYWSWDSERQWPRLERLGRSLNQG